MDGLFDTDVLICGAGAAGLTLAIDLARRGVAFRLIDKIDAPFAGSRGKGVQPRTLEVFEDLGLVDRLLATGGPYPPMREHREDGSTVDSPSMASGEPTAAEPYRTPLMVPQFLTERVMRERLAELGRRPEFGCELVDFEHAAAAVVARLTGEAGEETVRVRYLVGADGGRSTVRRALDIGFPGQTLGVRAIVADLDLIGLERDAWHRFSGGIGLCPLAGTTLFQLQGPAPPEGDIDVSAEGLGRMIAERTRRTDIEVHSVAWASVYTMNARLADRYRAGRVFLIGDAAHTHPPTGGQGLNTSVQDAYNLGWKIAAALNRAPDSLLDTYEAERRPIAAGMLGLSTQYLEGEKRGVSGRGREAHQLDLGYPDSSLSLEDPKRVDGLLAGDRAPDAPLRGAGGQPRRLFELFEGPHWTLLAYEVGRDRVPRRSGLHVHTIGEAGDFRDDGQHFRDGYGVAPGDLVLVRPDGYVGAIVSADRADRLDGYLSAVGLTDGT
jgi:2-polyprenyl-6-methoxyphenol hydroxylase-like FAD-dependent oxidoreductase